MSATLSNRVLDTVELARGLIRCPSVTPEDGGALGLLERALEPLGFICHRLRFTAEGTPPVENLYARIGRAPPNFCFAGHTDVVPPGPREAWSVDPFGGTVAEGRLYGRGAADMKGAVAAFAAAASRFLAERGERFGGSISLLITGDEEGPAINGTAKALGWLADEGEALDACLVGEPTNPEHLGDMIKIGRRGSLNVRLTAIGQQGHTAYPHLSDNAAHRLVRFLDAILAEPLDAGSAHFEPSTIAVSTIDVGNPARNVVPGEAEAWLNIRFGDQHSPESIETWLRRRLDKAGGRYAIEIAVSGIAFLTPPGPLSALVSRAVETVTGRKPALGTAGGTSDARFIKDHCPVVEFGLVGRTMHKADEHVAIAELEQLTQIYQAVLEGFFEKAVMSA
jgi:succinyl-diaminopimelate desuccinylase